MYPCLKPGDRVVVRSISPEKIEVGDIVAVPDLKGGYIIHRLVRRLSNGKGILKGDSMLASDPKSINLTETRTVIAIIRDERLIPLTPGSRSELKVFYAFLSLKGLTIGAIRLRISIILKRFLNFEDQGQKKIEWTFILDILKGAAPVFTEGLNLNRIQKISFMEGVAGPLFLYLKNMNISKSECSIPEKAYNANTVLNMKRIEMLKKLEQALDHEKIEVMTLKGASLLDHIYQDIGVRPIGDIDLMIRPGDREAFENLLIKTGYERDKQRTHIFIKDDISIDIHIHALNIDRIASRKFLFPEGMTPVWRNAESWRDGFKWLKRPDDKDNIILLTLHMMKHSFDKLFWWLDIILVLNQYDDKFWIKLRERAEYLKTERPLKYLLYLLNRMFNVNPPFESGLKDISKDLTFIEKRLLDERAAGQSIERLGVMLGLFCIKGMIGKLSFIRETLFPNREVIEQEFSKSFNENRGLFYLHRLSQTVSLVLKQFFIILRALFKSA